MFLFLLRRFVEVELLDHMVSLYFKETVKQFSNVGIATSNL